MDYHMNINEYFSQKETTYDPYLVCVLDLLGFSSYVLKKNRSPMSNDDAYSVLRFFQALDKEKKRDRHIAFFSDSVFLFQPLNFQQDILRQYQLLLDDVRQITEFGMQNHFLVRGGLCVGECHVEPGICYGPGIVKAHLLEGTKAHSARVVMTEEDYLQLDNLFKYTSQDGTYLQERDMLFYKGPGGLYEFDYLSTMFLFTSLDTDMQDCMARYKYDIENCWKYICATEGENAKLLFPKLDYHIRAYNRINDHFSEPNKGTYLDLPEYEMN